MSAAGHAMAVLSFKGKLMATPITDKGDSPPADRQPTSLGAAVDTRPAKKRPTSWDGRGGSDIVARG